MNDLTEPLRSWRPSSSTSLSREKPRSANISFIADSRVAALPKRLSSLPMRRRQLRVATDSLTAHVKASACGEWNTSGGINRLGGRRARAGARTDRGSDEKGLGSRREIGLVGGPVRRVRGLRSQVNDRVRGWSPPLALRWRLLVRGAVAFAVGNELDDGPVPDDLDLVDRPRAPPRPENEHIIACELLRALKRALSHHFQLGRPRRLHTRAGGRLQHVGHPPHHLRQAQGFAPPPVLHEHALKHPGGPRDHCWSAELWREVAGASAALCHGRRSWPL